MLEKTYSAAENTDAHVTAEHTSAALWACPPKRTCASGGVVMEVWQAASTACPELPMMLSWAMSRSITDCGPPRENDGGHAHAAHGGGLARAAHTHMQHSVRVAQ